ncbi:hypothetical protein Nepgr_021541 [Nepenthes gracilis]|uniref:Pectinesterase inhibitor domain-containing protein n=1 Tax=Nepenthes gracilis TaxID=150966 RepID=A0AAD3SXN1_NEPGR|nr:hypothetical protein Nepgr_021541 [Nepenthes gracilis]
MAKPTILLLFLSIFCIANATLAAATAAAAAKVTSSSLSFIKDKCNTTQYVNLCVQSLSPYASQIGQSSRELTRVALNVSLVQAESTMAFLRKVRKIKGLRPRELAAVKDCVDEMGDTVDELSESARELKRAGGARPKEFRWRMSNVQTWVSAALTDDSTCLDGFSGRALNGRVKASIRARMISVDHYTSNALALINQYAAKP